MLDTSRILGLDAVPRVPLGRAEGGVVGGADPVANFRSNLSRDQRFQSIMRNNMYFWWFTGEDTPPGWAYEAAATDLLSSATASSDHSGQEGGGSHAANNTILT